ncbi:MAG: hypothetical protein Q8N22_00050 [bacterium]|nr:hypothetical protein [bacterium]
MRKSLSKRIRITKRGKIIRKAMGQGHCRAKKSNTQIKRRKKPRGILHGDKFIKKHL